MLARSALCVLFLAASASWSRGETISVFSSNEVRAEALKDRLRTYRTALKDGGEPARKLSADVAEAFKGTSDWATSTEAYYARKNGLLKRAAAVEARVDETISGNSPESAAAVSKTLDAVTKTADLLRSDFEFYEKLPRLAATDQRPAALAAMRVLGQTGDFPAALAYFQQKAPDRAPYAAMPAEAAASRPR